MKKKLISTIISISVITGIFTPIPTHAEEVKTPNMAMADTIPPYLHTFPPKPEPH